jgi:hypothetical protein
MEKNIKFVFFYNANVIKVNDLQSICDETQKIYTTVFSKQDGYDFCIDDTCTHIIEPSLTEEQYIKNALQYQLISLYFAINFPFHLHPKLRANTCPFTKEIVEYVFHPKRMERMSVEYGMEMCEFIEMY